MVIGITGNSEKEKLEKFFSDNYSFNYVDVDEIFSEILIKLFKNNENMKINWKSNTSLILKIRNEVDDRISAILNSIKDNENVILDYSMLEDSYIFERCDLLIKAHSDNKKIATDDIELLKKHREGIISSDYKNSKYHLEINFDETWESKLKEKTKILNKTK